MHLFTSKLSFMKYRCFRKIWQGFYPNDPIVPPTPLLSILDLSDLIWSLAWLLILILVKLLRCSLGGILGQADLFRVKMINWRIVTRFQSQKSYFSGNPGSCQMLLRSSILVIAFILIYIHISNIGFLSSPGVKGSQKNEISLDSTLSQINDNFDLVGCK